MRRSVLEVFVQILPKKLKDQDHMSSERERIDYSDDACLIGWVMLLDGRENAVLNLAIIEVELFVSAYFDSDLTAGVFDVEALDHLSESSFVDYFCHEVSISNVLTDTGFIVSFRVSTFRNALPTVTSYSIDILKMV